MTQIKAAALNTTTALQEACPQLSDLTDNQREKLKYLRAMIGQLAAMADTEKAHIISYMLGMAYIEIGDVLKGDQPLSLPISKTIRHKEKYETEVFAAKKIARFLRVG